MERNTKLYGRSKSAFDYSKAEKRGRLEGTRDFTHKEVYLKYHYDRKNRQLDTV